jgi:hypothetical protein
MPVGAVAKAARGSLGAAQTIGYKIGSPDLVVHTSNAFVHGLSLASSPARQRSSAAQSSSRSALPDAPSRARTPDRRHAGGGVAAQTP